jgi:hypothetical protein
MTYNSQTLKVRDRKRYINLLKSIARHKSKVITGGGIGRFLKHKLIFMRRFKKIANNINKAAAPLEKLADRGKEQYHTFFLLIHAIIPEFNAIMDNLQLTEICTILKIDSLNTGANSKADAIKKQLFNLGQDIKSHERLTDNLRFRIEKQRVSNDIYVEKFKEANFKLEEAIRNSDQLLDFQSDTKIIMDLEEKTRELTFISKEGDKLRKRAVNYQSDFDKVNKLNLEFKQQKSEIAEKLLNYNYQVDELIKFYEKMILEQKGNEKNMKIWAKHINEFYKLLKSIDIKKFKEKLDEIVKLIDNIIILYKQAADSKLNTTYVAYFEKYRDMFIKYSKEYLDNIKLEIDNIKNEYFDVDKNIIPMKDILPRVNTLIILVQTIVWGLVWFASFLRFYKDSKFNMELKDVAIARKSLTTSILSPKEKEFAQAGGKGIGEWGMFINKMNQIIDNNDLSIDDKKTAYIETIDTIINLNDYYSKARFNEYYEHNTEGASTSSVLNKIGYFKRDKITDLVYKYYNVYDSDKHTFGLDVDKTQTIDLNQFTFPIDQLNPALIRVEGNLFLYYPGTKLLFHNVGAAVSPEEAQKYMFFCYVFDSKTIDPSTITDKSHILLLDIYTGYPILKIGDDHITLLDSSEIYDIMFDKVKISEYLKTNVIDIAKSIFTRNYASLQLSHQLYHGILSDSKDDDTNIKLFGKKCFENPLTTRKTVPMPSFDKWLKKIYQPEIKQTTEANLPLNDTSADKISKKLEDGEQLSQADVKKIIIGNNKEIIKEILESPIIVLSMDKDLKTFKEINGVEELEKEILRLVNELLKTIKHHSIRSKGVSTSTAHVAPAASAASAAPSLLDNMTVLSQIVQHIIRIETEIKTFKDKLITDIKFMEWDTTKTKERRLKQLKPEVTEKLQELEKAEPDSEVILKIISKFPIQDKFDEYMKKNLNLNDDKDGVDLSINYNDIIDYLKNEKSEDNISKFINMNFLDKPKAQYSNLFNAFRERLAYAIGGVNIQNIDDFYKDDQPFGTKRLNELIKSRVLEIKKGQKKKGGDDQLGQQGQAGQRGGKRTRCTNLFISSKLSKKKK